MTTVPLPLFVYGTLMDAAQQHELLGRVCASQPAYLPGYIKYTGKWPYVIEREGARVAGLLLHDLSDQDLAALDLYEAVEPQVIEGQSCQLYQRARRQALTESGEYVSCWLYLPMLSQWPDNWA